MITFQLIGKIAIVAGLVIGAIGPMKAVAGTTQECEIQVRIDTVYIGHHAWTDELSDRLIGIQIRRSNGTTALYNSRTFAHTGQLRSRALLQMALHAYTTGKTVSVYRLAGVRCDEADDVNFEQWRFGLAGLRLNSN